MRVPFLDLGAAHAELRDELDEAYRRVVSSGWFVLGPELEAFEAEFAGYCGVKYCVGVGNGLDALRLLLEATGIGPGDEVIVPAHTFIATWLAVSAVGATPVPVDVDPQDANLDPNLVSQAITSRTRALLPVHLFGRPADMARLRSVAERHALVLLEDAAQAHGATYCGKKAGSLGHAAAFSFYPAKNLGALGDGGAITTNDPHLTSKLRLLRNYGSAVKYQHDSVGWNSRLDELQASFLRVKLKRLDAWNSRRRSAAKSYHMRLAGISSLTLPPEDSEVSRSSWHLFVARHPARDALRSLLAGIGIETHIHYPVPPFSTAVYSRQFRTHHEFPRAEELARTCLSLPLSPHLTAESQAHCLASLLQLAPIASTESSPS